MFLEFTEAHSEKKILTLKSNILQVEGFDNKTSIVCLREPIQFKSGKVKFFHFYVNGTCEEIMAKLNK